MAHGTTQAVLGLGDGAKIGTDGNVADADNTLDALVTLEVLADEITVDSTNLDGTATTVQDVLEELETQVQTAASTHVSATGAHAATKVSVDSSNLDGTATNVQAVFEELETQVQTAASTHVSATGAHAATKVSFADTALYTANTDVETALAELYQQNIRSVREDFLDLAYTGGWLSTNSTGTTGNDIPFATVADGLGGTAQVATGTDALAAAIVTGPLAFKASTMGPIWMETRCKVVGTTTPVDGDFYIGFGDAKTYTADVPYVLSAAGATTTGIPTVGCFFGYTSITQTSGPIFDGDGADGSIFAITSVAGTDTVTALTAPAVDKDSSYHIYRIEISAAGVATFYIDGTLKATVTGQTASTAMAPQLSIVTQAAHENTLTIDYIAAGWTVDNAV